jgi:16S rRNA (uracil1498-N3)-methyltransferase
MRRFYASPDQFQGNEAHLSVEESKHLRSVLRLREGDEVSVFDGEGKEFNCRIKKTGKSEAVLEIISESAAPSPESKLNLTLAVALMKGDKFDLVIQKATELGVTKIVPLQTRRADIKIKDAKIKDAKIKNEIEGNKKLERWQRIALEAVKQCGRAKIPEITAPAEFAKFIGETKSTKIFFSERCGENLAGLISKKTGSDEITAIVGPEGGWEDSEIALARENGARIITLGGRILRAETAAITVAALLQNLYGDLN